MKDKEQDVFAEAAAQMHKGFPVLIKTGIQDRAQLERLYPSDHEMTVTLDAQAVEALSHYRQALSAFQAVGHGSDEGADLFLTSERAAEELGRLIADLAPATSSQ